MTYFDSITVATQSALDWDLPQDLLLLVITSEAMKLNSLENEAWEGAGRGW
jgi:hypothetical protein